MTQDWLDHIEKAERWLGLARSRADVPAKAADCLYKAADCLYEVIVEVTRALMELEHDRET